MTEPLGYTRIVLQLHHGAGNPPLIRLAAELARALELELKGVFVEDAALLALADLPFARELRLPSYEWGSLDAGRLAAELGEAARRAGRLVSEAAAASGIASAFHVARGDPATHLTSLVEASDIVVIAEPYLPQERTVESFTRVFQTAYRSAAAVVLVPSGRMHRRGPVATAITSMADASLAIAAAIARRAEEDLLLLVPPSLAEHAQRAAQAVGLPTSRVRVQTIAAPGAGEIAGALAAAGARVVVLNRRGFGGRSAAVVLQIARASGVPVLALDREPAADLP